MLILILTSLFIWLFYELYWKRRNLPPGPTPLPLIGNLHQLFWHQPGYGFTANNKKTYGYIYTWWMGPTPIVVLCDYELMKETFVKDGDSYSDKFHFKGMNEIFRGGNYGIAEANGERWREHRRFALHQLRDLGLGKMKMEERILEEVEDLTAKLRSPQKINIQEEIEHCISNIINQLMFGYRFVGEKEEELQKLKAMMERQKRSSGGLMLLVFLFPWARKLPVLKGCYETFLEFKDEFFGFFDRQIALHRDEIEFEAEDSTDYVDAYLKEQRMREKEGDYESFCNVQLRNVVFDLWQAGLSTTTASISWGIVYLLHHPDVQDKMHAELDNVVGTGRPVTMSDKHNLPYTSAVVMEIQRAHNQVVLNLPHTTTKDVVVEGYTLPKGTVVMADIGIYLYDEKLFPNPEKFDPERFLENGKFKTYPEVMSFSLGKRQCPGEGLAKMEIFLIIANMLNRFKLTSDNPPPIKKSFHNLQKPAEFIEFNVEYRF